jgi:heme exporter protein A
LFYFCSSNLRFITLHRDCCLQVKNLSLSRGGKKLLENVSLTLSSGRWLHLQGDNGVGKTTLLKAICTLATIEQGEILWNGQEVQGDSRAFLSDMVFMGHKLALKDELSARDNLSIATRLRGDAHEVGEIDAALAHFGLKGREQLSLGVLSQGQKRRVSLAGLMLARAPLWVLDEPFVALDAYCVQLLIQLINSHLDRGGAVLFTSHQGVELAHEGDVVRLGR